MAACFRVTASHRKLSPLTISAPSWLTATDAFVADDAPNDVVEECGPGKRCTGIEKWGEWEPSVTIGCGLDGRDNMAEGKFTCDVPNRSFKLGAEFPSKLPVGSQQPSTD